MVYIEKRGDEMQIKAEINFDIITDENEYIICDKIKKGLNVLLKKNLPSLIDDKSGEPLFNISVIPL